MPVKIFFCYAREDETLLKSLKMHLKPLQREKLIDVWYDREISAGAEWENEIIQHLNMADIILLLISPDFMDSDYCYGIEMKRAIERHERGEAQVVPIVLRPVYWQIASLNKLQALPVDGKPIVSPNWHSLDEAFLNVVEGIYLLVEKNSLRSESQNENAKSRINAENASSEYTLCNQVVSRLTPNQIKVLRAYAKGLNPQEVAEVLSINQKTVSTHSTAIFNECRFAWNMPPNRLINYHFLRENFAKYFIENEQSI